MFVHVFEIMRAYDPVDLRRDVGKVGTLEYQDAIHRVIVLAPVAEGNGIFVSVEQIAATAPGCIRFGFNAQR